MSLIFIIIGLVKNLTDLSKSSSLLYSKVFNWILNVHLFLFQIQSYNFRKLFIYEPKRNETCSNVLKVFKRRFVTTRFCAFWGSSFTLARFQQSHATPDSVTPWLMISDQTVKSSDNVIIAYICATYSRVCRAVAAWGVLQLLTTAGSYSSLRLSALAQAFICHFSY